MLSRVPLKIKDESNDVIAESLKEWLVFALLEVDPYSKPFYVNMSKIRAEIKAIDDKIKQVPKMEFKDAEGGELSQEEADLERETVFNAYR